MKKLKSYPVIIFFGVILYFVSIIDVFSPIKTYSETENRKLSTFPKFSWLSLIENKYTAKVEDFTEDHFIFRDGWISLKSISEDALGKTENNNIVYGKDGYMFSKITSIDEKRLKTNIDALNKFIQRHNDRDIKILLAPTAPGILKDKIMGNSPLINNDYILDTVFEGLGADHSVDVRDTLNAHKDEYIYYRTDHHWTTLGAYYAYQYYMQSIGLTPKDYNEFKVNEVNNFLGTHYSKAKSYNAKEDVLSYVDTDVSIEIEGKHYTSIYDIEKLDVRDKYAMFLHGNNGTSTIYGEGTEKIMIIKDSYANCFVPFMIEEFAQIDIFDMRNVARGLDGIIQNNDYDHILFIYNTESFVNDADLVKINMFNS